MKRFRCDGQGVEVGKTVLVRERTRLLDNQLYMGEVVKVVPARGDGTESAKDTVFIFTEDGVVSTHRHCVYATKANILNLLQEINDEVVKREDKIDYLTDSVDNRWHQMNKEVGLCPHCFVERNYTNYELSQFASRTEGYWTACRMLENAWSEKAILVSFRDLVGDVYDTYYDEDVETEDDSTCKWHFDITANCTPEHVEQIKETLHSLCGIGQVTYFKI